MNLFIQIIIIIIVVVVVVTIQLIIISLSLSINLPPSYHSFQCTHTLNAHTQYVGMTTGLLLPYLLLSTQNTFQSK